MKDRQPTNYEHRKETRPRCAQKQRGDNIKTDKISPLSWKHAHISQKRLPGTDSENEVTGELGRKSGYSWGADKRGERWKMGRGGRTNA